MNRTRQTTEKSKNRITALMSDSQGTMSLRETATV